MAKRDQGYMTQLREQQPKEHRHRNSHDERRAVLFLAVAGTMAFIVVMWIMVMPVQVAGLKLGGIKRAVVDPSTGMSATEQWNELMSGASARLKQTSDAMSEKAAVISPAAPNPIPNAPLDAAAITARLEAANATASAPAPDQVPNTPSSTPTPSR